MQHPYLSGKPYTGNDNLLESQRRLSEFRSTEADPNKQRKVNSINQLQSKFVKVLRKQETYPEQNAKFYCRKMAPINRQQERSRMDFRQARSIDYDECKKINENQLSSNEKQQILQILTKGYKIFKDYSAAQDKKALSRKLSPISKTIDQSAKADLDKAMIKKHKRLVKEDFKVLQQAKQQRLKVPLSKIESEVKERSGQSVPLRLLLSNKVRNKIIQDLISEDQEKMKENITKIVSTTDDYEWIEEFKELKNNLEEKQKKAKQKHHQKMISRSNYQNAYYQFLALRKDQKNEHKKVQFFKLN